jgi:hypothetical protein
MPWMESSVTEERLRFVARVPATGIAAIWSVNPEQSALSLVHRRRINGILSFRAIIGLVLLKLVEQRSVNPQRILFPNRPLPYSPKGGLDLLLPWQKRQVLSILDILSRFRKQQCKLFVRRLEDGQSTVQSAINDLNVFHSASTLRVREALDAQVEFQVEFQVGQPYPRQQFSAKTLVISMIRAPSAQI